jgi:TRAP-type C4-dicarboxylate transport system permease small subunit
MRGFHVWLGTALIVVNALAFLWGGVQWWRGQHSQVFWPLLRIGQALVIVEAVDGGILVVQGRQLPSLHLIYGLVPLAVSFVAEQLRLAAADQVLAQRGLEGRADVERLATPDQHALVRAILRRELGVMAASAGVVALLGVRAAGLL